MTAKPPTPKLDEMLCFNVYALNLAYGRLYQAVFAATGFTYPKLLVLKALAEAGPMSLSDLSARVGTESNSLSPMVKKMSEFGVIGRVRDPKDERRVMLSLLPYGEKLLAEADQVVAAAWDQLGLEPDEAAQLSDVLAKVRSKVDAADPKDRLAIPPKEA